MPYYILGGVSSWILGNFAVVRIKYAEHIATGSEMNYHVFMTIAGVFFVALASFIMDQYWLDSSKKHSIEVVVASYIAFLLGTILMAVLIGYLPDFAYSS